MKYYLVYLLNGKVVQICLFDNEEAQMRSYQHEMDMPLYIREWRYDSIQIFNEAPLGSYFVTAIATEEEISDVQ